MIVKKFHGETPSDAIRKVRAEWGSNAVILNTRRVKKGGILGVFKKEIVEITAAIDTDTREGSSVETTAVAVHASRDHELGVLREELRQTNELVRDVMKIVSQRREHPDLKGQSQWTDILLAQGLSKESINELTSKSKSEDNEDCIQSLSQNLEQMLEPYVAASNEGRMIAIVGPTGAGKTTTLAKLAAREVLMHDRNVAFITFDTYRISAVDQLRVYADILGVPLEVAHNTQELRQAIIKFNNIDKVLIDTVGRSHHNIMQLSELRSFIQTAKPDEIHLAISSTTDQQVMNEVIEAYSDIPLTHFLFTKLDETTRFGSIVNMLLKHRLPVQYFTNGQNVPDDIIPASTSFISRMILGENQ